MFPGLLKGELPLFVHFKAAEKLIHSMYLEKNELINADYSITIFWTLSAIASETKMPYFHVGNSIFCL